MTARRGRSGDEKIPGRVHGAWTTPAVVVRRPDGSIVNDDGGQVGDGAAEGTPAAAPRPRVRPRRIPGAPGAVLLVPTLCETGDASEGRRLRRNSGPPASVSPLPPRPSPPDPGDDDADAATPAAGNAGPPLAVVGAALRRARADAGDRGVPRPARVARALQGIDLGRFVPDDPDERAERLAKLRRVGVGVVGALVACLVIYTVFPVRTAVNLFDAEDRARERQAAFERENADPRAGDRRPAERRAHRGRGPRAGDGHARRGVLRHHAGAGPRGGGADEHHGAVDDHRRRRPAEVARPAPGAPAAPVRRWRGRDRRRRARPRPGAGRGARRPCGCGGCG